MKGTRALSFLLALALLASLVIPSSFALPAKAEDADKGMCISKTATDNGDGTYTITLEAYATGSQIISEVTEDVPTDIILVLDQSGSMAKEDFPSVGTVTYTPYTDTRNSNLYSKRHNNNGSSGNLYYQLEDKSYVTVSVTRTQGESTSSYTPCPSDWQNYKSPSFNDWNPDCYWKYSNNLYVLNSGKYEKVTVSYGYKNGKMVYTYTFPGGKTVVSTGIDGQPGLNNFDGNGPVYYLSSTTAGEYTYTYTYTDAEGNPITIGTSTGANNNFTGATLYYRTDTNGTDITRLAALQSAVRTFANSVAEKAMGKDGQPGTADDVNHRIAVVGFACSNTYDDDRYNDYQNTELFIGSNQYKYGTAAQSQYAYAFQSMNTTAGQTNVNASINALEADGATYVNLGMEIANGIFNVNPVQEGQSRNRVVVVFTDGVPGYSGYESGVANAAITQANTSRTTYGANVYAVGVFEGADATSGGNQNGNDTQKANWFMQNLSDNKGTVQTPSYYLSAANSSTLNNIFKQIANKIESGGSSATLTEEAVIRDIIAPSFQLPENATEDNITLKTYNYVGDNDWSENATAMGATATINGAQVDVTGFDFTKNWCGTVEENGNKTYRGSKLVISFVVEVRDGFLGGNVVETNANAGIYANANEVNPIRVFEKPTVDVPIGTVSVTPTNKNVYLLQNVSAETLKSGTTVTVGGVPLSLGADNYGLEPWQNAYVNIDVAITDKDGNAIPADGLTGLTQDNSYTVSVTVSPKNTGTYVAKSGSGTGAINVFKPELTYKDSEVYYGDTAPDYTGNLTDTEWKHGETLSDAEGVTMIGTAPTLALTYTPEEGKIANGIINTKQDIPVNVTASIGSTDVTGHTTFQHNNCEGKTCDVPNGGKFLLHVKTCQLTITKTCGASDEPYVFTVKKDGAEYTEVTVVGNNSETIYELPVGTYTIEEDTGWSWRYSGDNGSAAVLNANNPSGSITCTNSISKEYWLNGFSDVVKNVFGVKH